MASSVGNIQPPKARKRIMIGLSAKREAANTSSGCTSTSEAIAVTTEAHDNTGADSSKALSVLGKPSSVAAKASGAAKAKVAEPDSKPSKRRKSAMVAVELMQPSKPLKTKRSKDPNEPKRPPTAFFLFMEDFRRDYKKVNPNAKGGPALSKEGGEKWKSMSDEAKDSFVKRSTALKEEYQKALQIYKSNGKESFESTITDNAEEKGDVDIESCEETAASVDHTIQVEQ